MQWAFFELIYTVPSGCMDIAIFGSDLVRYGVAPWLDLIFDILNCCLFIGHVLFSSWYHGPVGTSQGSN
jgi:hypothetical protein